MYYTLTLNPALDYVINSPNFKLDIINSYRDEKIFSGGKGINVSIILTQLCIDNVALGFCAGFTGDEIIRQLDTLNVKNDFIKLEKGCSRINIKIDTGEGETEINGVGPKIECDDIEKLFKKLDQLKKGDVLIIAGSVGTFSPKNLYEEIGKLVTDNGVELVIDTADLIPLLKFNPLVIKPNKSELSKIFNTEIDCPKKAEKYGRKLFEMGAKNVLVSLGEMGAVLVNDEGSFFCGAVKGNTVSPCGAGDSMLGAFLSDIDNGSESALLLGVAAGAATAFSKGIATKSQIKLCRQGLKANSVEKINWLK